jgi:hypothetical protein
VVQLGYCLVTQRVQNVVVLAGVDFPCSRAPVPRIGNTIPVNRMSGRFSSLCCTVGVTSRYKLLHSFAGGTARNTHGAQLSISVSLLHKPSYKFCLGLAALLPEYQVHVIAFHFLLRSSQHSVLFRMWDVGSSIRTEHIGTVTFGAETMSAYSSFVSADCRCSGQCTHRNGTELQQC